MHKYYSQQIFILLLLVIVSSCEKSKTSDNFIDEVEQWKKELVLNGIVGPPCRDDNNWAKWQDENPEAYFGLQEVSSYKYDINNDSITDGLVYFNAINCVGGNSSGSDFAMLVYSHEGKMLTNKNITDIIERKIKYKLSSLRIYPISRVYIKYEGLHKTIEGRYYTWLDDDPSCCPSYEGTFKYDPINFNVSVNNKKNF